MNKVLIINAAQFGYHTDSFQYCKVLKKRYDITYVCYDTGKPKHTLEGINVIYVNFEGNPLKRTYRLLKRVARLDKLYNYNAIFLVYFIFCSFINIRLRHKVICDLRTFTISSNYIARNLRDFILKTEFLFFKYKTAISNGVTKKLWGKSISLLPLGGNIISEEYKYKATDGLRLFYLGTLHRRKLEDVIQAIVLLKTKQPCIFETLTFDIVGFGTKEDEYNLKEMIESELLTDKVIFHGRKEHSELIDIIKHCNVGICYYPQSPEFEHQPPTKLFEYILTGLPCLSIRTVETKKYISKVNGVLINQGGNEILEGLIKIYNTKYNHIDIRNSLSKYCWENVINRKLVPILDKVINE